MKFAFLLLLLSPLATEAQIDSSSVENLSWNNVMRFLSQHYDCGYSLNPETKISHIPQIHDLKLDSIDLHQNEELINLITAGLSQYHIAQLLIKNPEAAVFTEGAGPEFDSACGKVKGTDLIFPDNQIPSLESMSQIQIKALVRLGAPCLLRAMGKLSEIHQTEEWRANQKTITALSRLIKEEERNPRSKRSISLSKIYHHAQNKREKVAFHRVRKYSRKNPGQKVLLIYGAGHDFTDEFKNEDFDQAKTCESLNSLLRAPESVGNLLLESANAPELNQVKLQSEDLKNLCAPESALKEKGGMTTESKIAFLLNSHAQRLCPTQTFNSAKDAGATYWTLDCEITYQGRLDLIHTGTQACLQITKGPFLNPRSTHIKKVIHFMQDGHQELCFQITGRDLGSLGSAALNQIPRNSTEGQQCLDTFSASLRKVERTPAKLNENKAYGNQNHIAR